MVSLFDERSLEVLTVFAAQASLLLQHALLLDALRRENVALKEAVSSRQYGDLIGAGPSMREVYRRIEKVAGDRHLACWSPARPAPARRSSPARSTAARRAPPGRSSR